MFANFPVTPQTVFPESPDGPPAGIDPCATPASKPNVSLNEVPVTSGVIPPPAFNRRPFL